MAVRSTGYTVHHPMYPDGSGELLAWDYTATPCSEISTYLLRGARGYFVHYRITDSETGDSVLALDVADAAYLFRRLRVQVATVREDFD